MLWHAHQEPRQQWQRGNSCAAMIGRPGFYAASVKLDRVGRRT